MSRVSKFYESVTDKISEPSRRTIVEPSRGARIDRVLGGLRIVIPGWLGWGAICLHAFWLYWALSLSGNELLGILHGRVDWGTVGSLVFWDIHVLVALPLLFWQLAGREVVFIDGVWLSQRFELFGLGWTRRFPIADVRGLGVSSMLRPDAGTEWRPDMLRSRVSFSYAQKIYRLGWALSYGAALRVVRAIREAYPTVSRSA